VVWRKQPTTAKIRIVLSQLLPDAAVAAECFGDAEASGVFPAEAQLVAGAVAKRRREFCTARICAHRALVALGLPPQPVLSGPRGEPRWPRGIVGSITHCAGYRACALAPKAEVPSLGIDAEPHLPLPGGVLEAISSAQERGCLDRAFAGDPTRWDRLLFCLKESVYKAWYPLSGVPLGFGDVAIELDPGRRSFEAAVTCPDRRGAEFPATFSGGWAIGGRLVVASAVPS
jgi:4'-phosphopantetheinyl transferase EntD